MLADDVDLAIRRMQTFHAGRVVCEMERWAEGTPLAERVLADVKQMLGFAARTHDAQARRDPSHFELEATVVAAACDGAAAKIGRKLATAAERMAALKREAEREARNALGR